VLHSRPLVEAKRESRIVIRAGIGMQTDGHVPRPRRRKPAPVAPVSGLFCLWVRVDRRWMMGPGPDASETKAQGRGYPVPTASALTHRMTHGNLKRRTIHQ